MKTLLLIALVAAVTGLITSIVILYNLVFAKKKQLIKRTEW
jgi:hypothetical protein